MRTTTVKKVVVGLSGGVDSSVVAWLLKEQGYEVEALFMVNWHDSVGVLEGDCPAEHDRIIAQLVAKKLNISFHEIDLSEDYRNKVVEYMFDEYAKGRTPNPDVLCNREIKFGPFLDVAEKLGADYIATGHYCRKEIVTHADHISYRLLAGIDKNKDQSYFLCQLSQQQLAKTLFPIGDLEKHEVRRIAQSLSLPTADRKDSQGICFVGKVNLPIFLQQKLQAKEGDLVEIPVDFTYLKKAISLHENYSEPELRELVCPYHHHLTDGTIIGKHSGAHFYTIGQRKGLHIGGKIDPIFVLETDVQKNIVYVGMGQQHAGLYRSGLFIHRSDIHWINPDEIMKTGDIKYFMVRIRYRQPLQKARLFYTETGLYILFEQPQRGITAGQFAVWYDGDIVVGSGVIAL